MGDYDQDIRSLVSSIWEALFSRPLQPDAEPSVDHPGMVSSYIAIDGTWQGGILIEMPVPLANRLIAEMLMIDRTPTTEEMCDGVGELCNILAGNFKALVPAPSKLSLPVVTMGSDLHVKVVGAQSANSVPFTDLGSCFLITVHEGPKPV